MKNEELLKRVYTLAELEEKRAQILNAPEIKEEIKDLSTWEVEGILRGCRVDGDGLYDEEGNRLARGGLVENLYYRDQKTGYFGDNYYGYMYYQIDKNTYVKVYYAR